MKRIYFIKDFNILKLVVICLIFKNYIFNIKRNIKIIRFKKLLIPLANFFKKKRQYGWSGLKKNTNSYSDIIGNS